MAIIYEKDSGNYIESFTSKMLLPEGEAPPNAEEEENIKYCAEALYAGGADTVSYRFFRHVFADDEISC